MTNGIEGALRLPWYSYNNDTHTRGLDNSMQMASCA
jgi:hypothetical protein